jgi:hypothetical protein
MIAVVSRILARYLAAALMTTGLLAPDMAEAFGADPDVIIAFGALLTLGVEGLYVAAKRLGWST